jgi:uncharacterized membrane protein
VSAVAAAVMATLTQSRLHRHIGRYGIPAMAWRAVSRCSIRELTGHDV